MCILLGCNCQCNKCTRLFECTTNLQHEAEPYTNEFTCDVIILMYKYALDDIIHDRGLDDLLDQLKFSAIWSEFVWRLF